MFRNITLYPWVYKRMIMQRILFNIFISRKISSHSYTNHVIYLAVGWAAWLHPRGDDILLRFRGQCAAPLGGARRRHQGSGAVPQIRGQDINAATRSLDASAPGLCPGKWTMILVQVSREILQRRLTDRQPCTPQLSHISSKS